MSVGEGAFILAGLRIAGDGPVGIGTNVFINRNCYFDAADSITIGDGVRIADHVRLVTSTHLIGPEEQRAGAGVSQPITIGTGVWLGSGVTILPGVTIAPGCIIAAGAVVSRTTIPNTLYAGVPARELKSLKVQPPEGDR